MGNEKKNIIFISNLYPSPLYPGKASFNKQQIAAFSKYCNVDVVSPISWTEKFKSKCSFDMHKFGQINASYPFYYYTPKVFRKYYGHFFYKSIEPTVTGLCQKKKYDAIFASWLYPDGWAAAQFAKGYKIPFYVKVHGSDVNLLKKGSVVTKKSLEVVGYAQKTFCVSQALKAKLYELGAPREKMKVIYNGIDRSVFHPSSRNSARLLTGESVDKKTLLFVGNIINTKGVIELADAFVKVFQKYGAKDAHLVIIGDGPYLGRMQEIFSGKNVLKSVSFLGRLPLERVALWMNAADLLCLPSYMEGVPNVILEALACDTRVVATSVGGIPEIASQDDRLTLVEPMDTEQLFQALMQTLKKEKKINKTIQLNTWDENVAHFLRNMNLLD